MRSACPCSTTRRRCLFLAGCAALPVSAMSALDCRIDWDRPGQRLRVRLHNPGAQGRWLLRWGTPFEPGWWARWLQIEHEGRPLPYQGAQMKRAEPARADYFLLPAGAQRLVRVDLAPAWDLSAPGHYRLIPAWQWLDAFAAGSTQPPRPRAQHRPLPQAANSLEWRR